MPLQSSEYTCLFCSDFLFFRGRGALYKHQVRLEKIRSVERPKTVNRSLEKGGRGWRVGEARKQSRFLKREILLHFSTFIKATNPVEYFSRAEPSRHDDSVHLQQRKNILFPWHSSDGRQRQETLSKWRKQTVRILYKEYWDNLQAHTCSWSWDWKRELAQLEKRAVDPSGSLWNWLPTVCDGIFMWQMTHVTEGSSDRILTWQKKEDSYDRRLMWQKTCITKDSCGRELVWQKTHVPKNHVTEDVWRKTHVIEDSCDQNVMWEKICVTEDVWQKTWLTEDSCNRWLVWQKTYMWWKTQEREERRFMWQQTHVTEDPCDRKLRQQKACDRRMRTPVTKDTYVTKENVHMTEDRRFMRQNSCNRRHVIEGELMWQKTYVTEENSHVTEDSCDRTHVTEKKDSWHKWEDSYDRNTEDLWQKKDDLWQKTHVTEDRGLMWQKICYKRYVTENSCTSSSSEQSQADLWNLAESCKEEWHKTPGLHNQWC